MKNYQKYLISVFCIIMLISIFSLGYQVGKKEENIVKGNNSIKSEAEIIANETKGEKTGNSISVAGILASYKYDMAAPSTIHQLIAGEVYRQISNYILEHDGPCMPFISPVDVQLDCDDKTMLQPDVVILCDIDRMKVRCIYGAPDFVLEVISKSTRLRDYGKKLSKYMDAGVKEYWIVDPYQKRIMVYEFNKEIFPVIYGIDADIPVGLYDGRLTINLAALIKKIEKLL